MGGYPEGDSFLRWRSTEAAIGPGLPAFSIQQDPLAIQAIKGADAEITVLQQVGHF